ncbi:MAG: 4'-phosphopantetheinyl transferase family protein [Armatimonadota bacterium]
MKDKRAECITVWRVALDIPPEMLAEYEAILSADERRRAARFRFPRDRRRFIACHAALRRILSAYLKLSPAEIRFTANPYGKPALEGGALHFNLSHAHELALIAVAEREVGVDVEYLDPEREQIARSCCTPGELAAVAGLPAGALAYWTGKEAYLKGLGTGFAIPPDRIQLDPPPIPAARTGVTGDPAWSIYPFVPAPGYRAAVAARGEDWQVDCGDWPVTPSLG